MLSRTEKKQIRETILNGGSVRRAISAFAKGRGYTFRDDTFYVTDIESFTADYVAERERNTAANVSYQTDEQLRALLARGTDRFGYCETNEEYDSETAWDLATATHMFRRGKPIADIADCLSTDTYHVRRLIRPLLTAA
jgi:hypothetical protein